MKRQLIHAALLLLVVNSLATAAEHRVEPIDSPAPARELSEEIAATLAPTGIRVVRGESRAVLEFWPCKSWELQADFEPTFEVLYPFKPGELIGVVQLPRRGNDFREQRINRGVYTLRYALQPVDGNHVGTSPTRDFLLLVRADMDESAAPIDAEELQAFSAEAAESSHPAMLSLQPRREDDDTKLPSLRHDEERDWWILRFAGKSADKPEPRDVIVELVVVGHAVE